MPGTRRCCCCWSNFFRRSSSVSGVVPRPIESAAGESGSAISLCLSRRRYFRQRVGRCCAFLLFSGRKFVQKSCGLLFFRERARSDFIFAAGLRAALALFRTRARYFPFSNELRGLLIFGKRPAADFIGPSGFRTKFATVAEYLM